MLLQLINIILILLTLDNVIGERCEEGWEDKVDEGLNCLFFGFSDTNYMNHTAAKQFCANKEAHLIELKSEEELNRLSDCLNAKNFESWAWWGGATKVGGQWKWAVSGELLGHWIWGNWGSQPGEKYPNSDGTCFAFSKTAGNRGKWKGEDRKCDQQQTFTICQKKYVSINLKIRWSLVITISISI